MTDSCEMEDCAYWTGQGCACDFLRHNPEPWMSRREETTAMTDPLVEKVATAIIAVGCRTCVCDDSHAGEQARAVIAVTRAHIAAEIEAEIEDHGPGWARAYPDGLRRAAAIARGENRDA